MLKWFSPGDFAADIMNLAPKSENRMILRMYVNVVVYGLIATAVAFWIAT